MRPRVTIGQIDPETYNLDANCREGLSQTRALLQNPTAQSSIVVCRRPRRSISLSCDRDCINCRTEHPTTKLPDEPHAPWSRRFSPFAAVSRALDFALAAHASAFALLGPRQNRVRASSAHASTAPALQRCAVRCWRPHAYGTFRLPWPGTDMPYFGGSWLRT